jgi:hypothetical protein
MKGKLKTKTRTITLANIRLEVDEYKYTRVCSTGERILAGFVKTIQVEAEIEDTCQYQHLKDLSPDGFAFLDCESFKGNVFIHSVALKAESLHLKMSSHKEPVFVNLADLFLNL